MESGSVVSSKHGVGWEAPLWVGVALISAAALLTSIAGMHTHILDYVLLSISVILIIRAGLTALTKRRVSVDVLMGVAGLTTWLLHLTVSGFLIFLLYALSELIEAQAERYAERKIVGLRELIPATVHVDAGGKIVAKGVNELLPGEVLVVKPGEVVPADGVIISGESLFDTSYITGESVLRRLGPGSLVVSGYVNKRSLVRVRVLKSPRESLLQLLVREAEMALSRKASLQRFIERFSQPYVFVVLAVFMTASALWSPYRALPLLLAGCPSAFIISSSTATALALAVLARRSIVVRGGRVLEDAGKLRALILDKTGTITLGKLRISRVTPLNGFSEDDVVAYGGAAAKASNHPVSRTLAELSPLTPSTVREFPGKGLEAVVDGREVLLGSREFMEESGVVLEGVPPCGEGEGAVFVAVGKVLAGVVCLEEVLDEGVRSVVGIIKERGIKLVIASGDDVKRVKRVAEYVGVNEYYGGLSPDAKKNLVRELRLKYSKVGFVGDGINDVEAIAEADVGMAVGKLEVVSNIGDVVLLRGVRSIPQLLEYARRYGRAVYSAIVVSAIVKVVAMVLGVAGLLPLYLVVGVGDDGATMVGLGLIATHLLRGAVPE